MSNPNKEGIICKECGSDWVVVYARGVKNRTSYDIEYYIHCHQCNKTDWIGVNNEKSKTSP